MLGMAVVAATLLLMQSPTSAPDSETSKGALIYEEQSRNVAISYRENAAGSLLFESTLPAGWTFQIRVDGNKDGKWGYGPGMPDPKRRTSPDRTFGQDSRNGVFCSQYIFTTVETDPSQVQFSSQCGDLPSKGKAILGGFNADGRVTIALELPPDEIFDSESMAHVQACVWDTVRWHCQQSLSRLQVLTRRPVAT